MTRISVLAIATITCCVSVPRAAGAQPVRSTWFAGVTAGAAYDDSYHRIPGGAPSTGFSFGVINDRRALQLEFDISGWHSRDSTPHRYQYVGATTGLSQQGHFYEDSFQSRHRSASVTALYARRVRNGRVLQAMLLMGGGMVFRPSRETWVTKEVLPDGTLQVVATNGSEERDNHPAFVVGIDAELRISQHVSLVPSVRLIGFPLAGLDDGGYGPTDFFVARPQVAIRWRF